ncbi:hypothetical protein [Phytoactinopolyspora limicola]|uniref:hypothetical protein n=1 Tax=Phytoactinopolyspora limicola TaxID=2715536 RepID=UPI00140C7780|nr:hypothetical protein [Phytoactinopolyspora limicola]
MDDLTAADRALLADLRDAFQQLDPPPPHLLHAAHTSLDWMNADAILAELVADSAATGAPALRAAAPPRVLTFDAEGTTLVVEIVTVARVGEPAAGRRVIGQVLPAGDANVEIRTAYGAAVQVRADGHGRFRATEVPAGPLAFSCQFDDPTRTPFVTGWTTDQG